MRFSRHELTNGRSRSGGGCVFGEVLSKALVHVDRTQCVRSWREIRLVVASITIKRSMLLTEAQGTTMIHIASFLVTSSVLSPCPVPSTTEPRTSKITRVNGKMRDWFLHPSRGDDPLLYSAVLQRLTFKGFVRFWPSFGPSASYTSCTPVARIGPSPGLCDISECLVVYRCGRSVYSP